MKGRGKSQRHDVQKTKGRENREERGWIKRMFRCR